MRLSKNALPFALGLAAAPFLPLVSNLATSEPDLVRSFSRTVQKTAESVAPAVVSIEAYYETSRGTRSSQGSGVILSENGLIVTNYHVAGEANEIRVLLADGRRLEARLRGGDHETDLAVLQIDARGTFKALELRQEPAQIGEYVLAVGNPLGFDQTVTSGIISARARRIGVATYEDFLQTDAAINPGNSGGPLIDLDGRVVGINTALELGRGSQGLGFAIPADMVRDVFDEIMTVGRVRRGFLGVNLDTIGGLTSERIGLDGSPHVVIKSVVDDGPAERAGIESGDVVLVIGNRRIEEEYDVLETVASYDPGDVVRVLVFRDGRRAEINVRVGERPDMRDR